MKLTKDECISIFKMMEGASIQGKDAFAVSALMSKLDKEIVRLLKIENTSKVPGSNKKD